MSNEIIMCACGCGQQLDQYDNRGRKRNFVSGHNSYKYRDSPTRPCTRCGETKPIDQFYKNSYGYGPWCKSCTTEYAKSYYSDNREQIKTKALQWNQDNVLKKRLYNRERSLKLVDEQRKRARDWATNNPEKRKAQYHKREAQKRGNGGSFTDVEWKSLCDKYGNKCVKCGAAGALQADHIIPLALGGSSNIDNIQPLCAPCNFHKHLDTSDYRPLG